MTTTTIAVRPAEQYSENNGWNQVAQAVGRAGQNAAGLFGRVGKTLWTVSVELQPFQRSFSPPHGVARRNSKHVWPTEQASIDSIMIGS
ncbi:MAG: hypothetical protein QF714_06420 [Dehalococcoidia bacterium]|nr:hypothetical protein [Dehalococcoidia bacterium]MDP6227326.1 hypothetical protein [Dehalococcoidia bacterium]MDP7082788.1 hypothetical protein [Dehalococcoidia bacterium]MDP7200218.1 hypothetical protein [Dehalococcoidia bacterium]MDP7511714.1 hypothetical protein [Dehalococcoidia bacterium]